MDKRETKSKDTEDPDIDITIEEIRRRIRQEEATAEATSREKGTAEGGAQESQSLDESTDSDFTVTYDEAPTSPHWNGSEKDAGIGADRGGEEARAEAGEQDGVAVGGTAKKLSPRQRLRQQSLARFKKKQWGSEGVL